MLNQRDFVHSGEDILSILQFSNKFCVISLLLNLVEMDNIFSNFEKKNRV